MPEDKNDRWRLMAGGVAIAVLGVLLVWAEEHWWWYAAQASLVTLLLLSTVMISEWWKLNHRPLALSGEAAIYHRAIHKLLLFTAIGFFALIMNATRVELWEYRIVFRAIGYGTLCAGAFFVLGVLLGYLFGLRPTGHSQTSDEKAKDGSPVPYTNLEEIADWFTKLILGAGLVSLTRLRDPLRDFARFMASGVEPSPPPPTGYQPSPAVAFAIMLFFSATGVLYGYLWTRYEYEMARKVKPKQPEQNSHGGSKDQFDHQAQ